ncbi:MAG: S8 family serine peptidase [Chloroflexota bacterium]
MTRRWILVLALMVVLVFVGSPDVSADSGEQSYLILARGNSLSRNLEADVTAAGGALTNTIPEVGIAVATSSNPSFQANMERARGVRSVVSNLSVQWVPPVEQFAFDIDANPPNSGDDDPLFDLQWGHDAVDAPEAWDAGARGAGARVAVLDTGFDLDHPDLVPNINFGLSKDFTGEGLQYTLADVFSHGTHTAGTIAAADNAFGVIGVAPEAELVLVKVLGDEGSGTFEDVIAGIVHAANVEADVINMSLGATLLKSGDPDADEPYTAREANELKNAIGRAVAYAHQSGTTVIASAGNDGRDGDKDKNAIHLPSDAPHAVSISATGPLGWALDPGTDLDVPAFYTNYGQSVIDFAAPGGNVDFDLMDSGVLCTVSVVTAPCWAFDLVYSTGNGGWYWSAGTSMSAPHAAGVAALIIGANGGDMHPARVEAALRSSADDLGDPGQDDFYGAGRVNAFNYFD